MTLFNEGTAIVIAHESIGKFPGRYFAFVESGDYSGAHFTDDIINFAGFQFAYQPAGPFPVTAVVIPIWPLWLLALFIPFRAWRRHKLPLASFPVISEGNAA